MQCWERRPSSRSTRRAGYALGSRVAAWTWRWRRSPRTLSRTRSGRRATDRRYLAFEERFGAELLDQGRDEQRSLTESLDRSWRAVLTLPRQELTMLPAEMLARHG